MTCSVSLQLSPGRQPLNPSGTGLAYETGDHLAVCPQNSDETVAAAAALLGVDLDAVLEVTLPPGNPERLSEPFPCPTTVRTALQQHASLLHHPDKHALEALAACATSEVRSAHRPNSRCFPARFSALRLGGAERTCGAGGSSAAAQPGIARRQGGLCELRGGAAAVAAASAGRLPVCAALPGPLLRPRGHAPTAALLQHLVVAAGAPAERAHHSCGGGRDRTHRAPPPGRRFALARALPVRPPAMTTSHCASAHVHGSRCVRLRLRMLAGRVTCCRASFGGPRSSCRVTWWRPWSWWAPAPAWRRSAASCSTAQRSASAATRLAAPPSSSAAATPTRTTSTRRSCRCLPCRPAAWVWR